MRLVFKENFLIGSKNFYAEEHNLRPQGTVLGPLIFDVYINDILDNAESEGLLFADDTKIYRAISSTEDAQSLHSDLNTLEEWSDEWLLRFQPDKCHLLT